MRNEQICNAINISRHQCTLFEIRTVNLNKNGAFKGSNHNLDENLEYKPWSTIFQIEISQKTTGVANTSTTM